MSKTRILFVDDDANIVDGLRRLLRRQRDQWDMVFVTNAAEAMARMAEAPFDVVVTDMQMPGINGADLLESVVANYPEVGRIVLSGQTDEATATRAMDIAHQFLSKPTSAETLKLAVERACLARKTVKNRDARAIALGVGTLPTPPHVYTEIVRVAASENVGTQDIARIIARDPGSSAKVLQLVNSSFFGLARKVSNIEQAVSLLGIIRVKSLVLSSKILEQFELSQPIPGFSLDGFLRRSAQAAQGSRIISVAEGQRGDRPDQAFAAGLLHDVGVLVLAARCPDQFAKVLRDPRCTRAGMCAVEQEILGTTHGEVAECLLQSWNLPPRIVEGVALHHCPGKTGYDGVSAVTVVHASAALLPSVNDTEPEGETESVFAPEMDVDYLKRICLEKRIEVWEQAMKASLLKREVSAT